VRLVPHWCSCANRECAGMSSGSGRAWAGRQARHAQHCEWQHHQPAGGCSVAPGCCCGGGMTAHRKHLQVLAHMCFRVRLPYAGASACTTCCCRSSRRAAASWLAVCRELLLCWPSGPEAMQLSHCIADRSSLCRPVNAAAVQSIHSTDVCTQRCLDAVHECKIWPWNFPCLHEPCNTAQIAQCSLST
jgi:hypothetical protein